jgi:protein-disulfide isomerase
MLGGHVHARAAARRRSSEINRRSTPLTSKTDAPAPPSRHERRLADRAARANGTTRRAADAGRRGISPLIWVTAGFGLIGIVIIGALVISQGTAPKPINTAGLKSPIGQVPAGLADGRVLGKADAPVTLEVWSDYQCPVCGQFAELIEPSLVSTYVANGTLRIIYHDAAFQGARSSSSYDESVEAAAAARCAADQNLYWQFHNWLFANQVGENQGAFRDERLRAIATKAGVDVAAWDACRATGQQQTAVRAETDEAVKGGINATPTMHLNGQVIVGLRSASDLGAMIEAAAAAPSPS